MTILLSQELVQTFWRTVRPFLTNKEVLIDNEISLMHNGKTIDDEKQVVETLTHAYINIVEHTAGNKPTSIITHSIVQIKDSSGQQVDLLCSK